MSDGEERYWYICLICGKKYYRRYASDSPGEQWWLNISHALRERGGVCSAECARKTEPYKNDKQIAMRFIRSLDTEQKMLFNEFIIDFIRDDYEGEYWNLFKDSDIETFCIEGRCAHFAAGECKKKTEGKPCILTLPGDN